MGAYEEACELLREFGGLLGRPRHEPRSAEEYAYSSIASTKRLDLPKLTAAMASRPRAFGENIVRGDAAPMAEGVSVGHAYWV